MSASALFLLLLLAHSVLVPTYRGPDEPQHVDLVRTVAHDWTYPFNERTLSSAVVESLSLVEFDTRSRHLKGEAAVPRGSRPTFSDIGSDEETDQWNQISEHPPLFYFVTASALAVFDALEPGPEWSYDGEVGLMRIISLLFVAPVPLLVFLTARRLRASSGVAFAAAILPAGIPQLTHIGAVVNNDDLVAGLGALLAYLCVRVMTGDDGHWTSVAVGVTGGALLLTKGQGIVAVPLIASAYLVPGLVRRPPRVAVLRMVTAGVAGITTGGWWYVRNLLTEGDVQPHTPLTRDAPPEFMPDFSLWVTTYAKGMARRFFGDFGWFDGANVGNDLAVGAALVALVGLGLGLVAGLWRRRPEDSDDLLSGRLIAGAITGSFALLALYLAYRNWRGHSRNGVFAGIQGRYLFIGVGGVAPLVAIGWARVRSLARWLPLAVVVSAGFMQWQGIRAILRTYWASPGASAANQLSAMAAWSPFASPLIWLGAILLGAATLGVLALALWFAAMPDDDSSAVREGNLSHEAGSVGGDPGS